MSKTKPEITDIVVDGNTVRFKKHKGGFKVKIRVPMVKAHISPENEKTNAS